MADEMDGLPTPEEAEAEEVEAARASYRVRLKGERLAKRDVAAENWKPPRSYGSLAKQAANPEPPVGWFVDQVIPDQGIVQITAQWKAGKTTLGINLAAALATGEDFLGAYPVKFDGGNIGIWNLEVGAGTMQQWLFARVQDRRARKRIYPQHLRGSQIDLLNELAAEWAVEELRRANVKVWIIDPLSKLYQGNENDNTEFNEWWRALEAIMVRAGVEVIILIHHAGHAATEGGSPRARGASAMLGNPDELLTYRHAGNHGESPPDDRRYLRGFGRHVKLDEITLGWEPATQSLYRVESSGGRDADRMEGLARRVAETVWASGAMTTNAIQEALGGKSGTGSKAAQRAVNEGWLTVADGPNRSKLYSPGPVNPSTITIKDLR